VPESYTGKYLKPILERDRLRMKKQIEDKSAVEA
jgi:excinuclease ABC subunit A